MISVSFVAYVLHPRLVRGFFMPAFCGICDQRFILEDYHGY